jgi:hypothetical protein
MKRATEVGNLIRQHIDEIPEIVSNPWKRRTMYAVARCRTAAMGGHIDQCDNPNCNKVHISYNSCRNRHCPKCQGHLREQWIQAREGGLLNTKYFHVVFTLPHHLNELVLQKPDLIYGLLFKTAWSLIKDFGCTPKLLGAAMGMIAILHTWGQNLSLHPHLHCIIPAGGITKSNKWKATSAKGKPGCRKARYLFPIPEMKKVFRARFVSALRKEIKLDKTLSEKLFQKSWVIHCEQPFYGPKQVIEYLGRYTHKIAISNSRIMSASNGQVTFRAKDYRHKGKKVVLQLSEKEFIRRFSLHILPKGFTRIRHYGILSSTNKKACKHIIDEQLGPLALPDTEKKTVHRICPYCKKGTLVTISVFDERGPPIQWKSLLKI